MYTPAEVLFPSLLTAARENHIIKSETLKYIPEIEEVMVQECKAINEEYSEAKDENLSSFLIVNCGIAAASAVYLYTNDYENYKKIGIYDSVESEDKSILEVSEELYGTEEIAFSLLETWNDFLKQVVNKYFNEISSEQHLQFCIAMFMLGMTLGMEKLGL